MSHFFNPAEAAAFSDEKMKKVNLFDSPRMFCDVYCLKPGQFQKDHDHANNDKIYHVLTGTPIVRIGDERRAMSPGETAVAPAGVIHGVINDSNENTTLLVVMAPNPGKSG